ncbi:MAG: AMP-binding protein [Gemmatimonadaceae bacterium]|nr:AMP-binding protein [Gemmatimonadaceae bacterium]
MKTLLQHVYDHERDRADRTWLTQPMGSGMLREFTWKEALHEARRMASYLRDRGYPPGSRIAILSKNCAWWFLADLAIWMAGHVSVPIYPTLSADSVAAILDHSEARLVFVGKIDQFGAMEPGIPRTVERVAFPLSPEGAGTPWDAVVASCEPLTGRPDRHPDDLATIMYTSGSTGMPKGVMHSFRTMDHSRVICALARLTAEDRFISYLPLAHVAERALLECTCFLVGFSVWFVERLETFVQDVQRARPTVFGSVPRLWMQFQAGVFAKVPERKLSRLLRLPVIGWLVRRKVLAGLGLAHVRVAFYGSAPSPAELIAWYRRLGLELVEIYGMTEGWAYSHMGIVGRLRPGWVGPPVPGVEQRLTSDGEVLVKTPGLMLGYFRAADLTREMIDDEGWLHTGDRGEIDDAGRLRITGRVKELFKTSKGKYVAPAPIENRLLADPRVEQACVSGAGLPQPYAIVVLSRAAHQDGAVDLALAALRERVNAAVDPHERLQLIVVAEEPWTVENGLLTPTLKLKRSAIEMRYEGMAEAWYRTGATVVRAAR